jgi:hypothetical protein
MSGSLPRWTPSRQARTASAAQFDTGARLRTQQGLSHGLCVRADPSRKDWAVPHAKECDMPSSLRRGHDWTREQWLQATENARREARYRHAEQRVRKILDGMPPLTVEQRARLARLLLPAGNAS